MRLLLHGVCSLKDKRSIVRRIIGRTRSAFDISIAEVGENDRPGNAVIGFAVVGNDRPFVNACLDSVVNHIERMCLADIVDHAIEIVSFNI
jgi:uncharacterized protein